MGKQKKRRVLGDHEAMAISRTLRVSPQKLNLVAATIRGRKVSQAIASLTHSRRRISTDVMKCLMSAVANAENNHSLDVDQLVVKEAYVGKSMTMKRFRPRARGRTGPIAKPFSRLTIKVQEVEGDI